MLKRRRTESPFAGGQPLDNHFLFPWHAEQWAAGLEESSIEELNPP